MLNKGKAKSSPRSVKIFFRRVFTKSRYDTNRFREFRAVFCAVMSLISNSLPLHVQVLSKRSCSNSIKRRRRDWRLKPGQQGKHSPSLNHQNTRYTRNTAVLSWVRDSLGKESNTSREIQGINLQVVVSRCGLRPATPEILIYPPDVVRVPAAPALPLPAATGVGHSARQ